MQTTTLRTFFACRISDENLSRIDHLLVDLKNRIPDSVKWVSPKNLHLTIKFLGEFKQTDVEPVKAALTTALLDFQPFPISIHDLGAFPSPAKPQIIWLGLEADQALYRLVETLEQQCALLGYPREKRPFAAHITIGRLRQSASPTDSALIAEVLRKRQSLAIGEQSIDALHFFKSELTQRGPIYQTLFTLPFVCR
jgi:2'-5' RNA ligase